MPRRIEKDLSRLQRQVSQRGKQQVAPDPQTAELAYLEWHYRSLSATEKQEHDRIIAEIAAAPELAKFSDDHAFDVASDPQEVNADGPHIHGCSCFRCVQNRSFHRGIGIA